MKKRLFYLIGTAFLMCATGTFTSCVNGVDDEYLEQKNNGDTNDKGDESETPDINGDYYQGGDFELKMTYNGEELIGKKVTVLADEDLASASFTLAGTEKDLSALNNLLVGMNAIITTYSPVPGEKEILVKNVKLYRSGKDFIFEGEDPQPTRLLTFKGTIKDDVMTIDITHKFTREENDLLGAWKMGEAKEGGTIGMAFGSNNKPETSSPLWLDWGSNANVNMGKVPTGIDALPTLTVNRPMNGIFNLLMSDMVTTQIGNMLQWPAGIEKSIPLLIKYVATEETGGMYASYSYTGTETPEYSTNMSHNIMRYYFDADNKLRIEANADYLLTAVGGLLGDGSTKGITRAQPDNSKIIGKELVDKLRPALEQGFPCEYTIEGDNMTINIDGAYLLDVMRIISRLVNDEFSKEFIYAELGKIEGIGDYFENIKLLLQNLPNALGDDCQYIKLGFRMARTTPEADVTE